MGAWTCVYILGRKHKEGDNRVRVDEKARAQRIKPPGTNQDEVKAYRLYHGSGLRDSQMPVERQPSHGTRECTPLSLKPHVLYRPCSASIPYLFERVPALSVTHLYLASSLSSKQQIDVNLAVGSVGCVTTCRMSPCKDRTRTRLPYSGSSRLAPMR